MKPFIGPSVLALSIFAAFPSAAHHSPSIFDLNRELTLEGTVTAVSWRNPHVYLAVEVAGPDGSLVEQQIEAAAVSNMVALGVDANTIRPGEHVVVQVKPHRSPASRIVLGWVLTRADGTIIPLNLRAQGPTVPGTAAASSLAGTWVPQGRGFANLSAAARSWPLTEAGRAAAVATADARRAVRSECIPYGPPAIMSLPVTIVVAMDDRQASFKVDVMNTERVVHLDQAEHPSVLEPSLFGHSIGHWEGATLVVDTVGYAAHPEGFAFDLPSSGSKHVVERFTLSADGKHLDYEAIVEDSEYLAEPVTHRWQWDYRPDQRPSGLPCEPEVAGRFATGE